MEVKEMKKTDETAAEIGCLSLGGYFAKYMLEYRNGTTIYENTDADLQYAIENGFRGKVWRIPTLGEWLTGEVKEHVIMEI